MKKIIKIAISLIIIVAIGFSGKTLLKKRQEEIKNAPLPVTQYVKVKLYTPKEGSKSIKRDYVANVEAKKSIKISTKIPGKIKKIYVQEAQDIKSGKLLVKIDENEILSNLKALKSNLNTQKSDLNIAKKIYQRNIQLFNAGALPKEKLELSSLSIKAKQSAIANTESKIAQIKNQLSYLNIKAPFSGTIDTILMHEGDLAVTGKPILSLSSNDKKLLITFNKKDNLKKNDKVYYKNSEIGYIKTIYKVAKNGLNVAEIELTKDIDAATNSTINIAINLANAKGCLIPQESILQTKDGYFIYEYNNKSFKKIKIEPTLITDNFAIIEKCPNNPIAMANEPTLVSLIAYKNVMVIGEDNATK